MYSYVFDTSVVVHYLFVVDLIASRPKSKIFLAFTRVALVLLEFEWNGIKTSSSVMRVRIKIQLFGLFILILKELVLIYGTTRRR